METALRDHPRLAGYPLEFQATEGRVLQASLRPNPELSVDVENVWWDYPGTSRSETTYGISQLVELGKRSSRIRKAAAETGVLRRDYEIARFDVVADVKRAFVNFLSAGKKLALNREAHKIATELATAVSGRVAAGAVSPIEETRANVALAVSSADVERTAREVETARRELAAAMGEATPSFDSPSGDLDEDLSVPAVGNVAERIAATPDMTRWGAELGRRNAALNAERTLAAPDVTLKGGIRRFRESSENAFVLGISVPLPLFSRNQGAIREAEAQRAKVDVERKTTEVLLHSQVGQRLAALTAAAREASILRKEAVPGAQSAYDAVSEGYRLGKFRYLDVLDTGKSLIETRLRYLEALTALNLARVDLERLMTVAPIGKGSTIANQGASR
ncbi:TolC family protein [Candidatus Deferrimicrobium sp.]|uniref:TolC family protein n=1 Tax=Candidatus Deferrimicrobium sp. TaxID=3060586 RepID=UPI0027201058|nr:TolC family protein [Candidatus Deferrimicrobium sp.]MDO8738329.1 TolC family protein [Candidatus Deferrimicrobium sp.]